MCGIFGIINKKQQSFDYQTFCTLGIDNDTRGGDSCGIFIDGEVEYGVDKEKLFDNFFLKSKLLNETKKAQIAIGHCRKASVGVINRENAQPVVIKDSNNNIEFVLIHNGTILNYKELAKKYIPNINISNMTDSKVMCNIFYYAGYDVLGEYIGAGAFVIIDYRSGRPEVRMFRGESKLYSYSNTTTEERPLFFTTKGDSLYFSSISRFLYTIDTEDDVYTLKTNNLCVMVNGSLKIEKQYDRKNIIQKETSVYAYNYGYNYNAVDNYYNQQYNNLAWDASKCNTTKEEKKIIAAIYVKPDMLGRYYYINKCGVKTFCHGVLLLNEFGRVVENEKDGTRFWFYLGTMLYNKSCFDFFIKLKKEYEIKSDIEFYDMFAGDIQAYSPDPYFKDGKYYESYFSSDGDISTYKSDGEIEYAFSRQTIMVKDGIKLSEYETVSPGTFKSEYRLRFETYVSIISNNSDIVKRTEGNYIF